MKDMPNIHFADKKPKALGTRQPSRGHSACGGWDMGGSQYLIMDLYSLSDHQSVLLAALFPIERCLLKLLFS